MVRTPHRIRTVLAASALGAGLTAGVSLAVLLGSPASAQGETSSAYGVSATGVDSVGAQPLVNSAGELKSASGTVSGKAGTFSATGITVKAGAGLAEATVAKITVGSASIGPVSAKCTNGVTRYTGSGPAAPTSNMRVSYGGGAGAVITIVGAGGKPAQTITVAVAKCGKGNPTTNPTPPSTPPSTSPSQPPGSQPTGRPTGTSNPTSSRRPIKPEQTAPTPQPRDGRLSVTG